MPEKKGQLNIKIEGPEVVRGRIEIGTFTEIIQGIYKGLRRVALNTLEKYKKGDRGRYPKDVEEICRIAIADWKSGSILLTLEAIPPKQMAFFPEIDEVMTRFVDGLVEFPKAPSVLPAGFDPQVVAVLEGVASRLSKTGITHVRVSKHVGKELHEATVEPRLRTIFEKVLKQTKEAETVVEGKFYQVNLKQQSATLEEFGGRIVSCHFNEGIEMQIIEGLTHPVRVYGKGTADLQTNRITHLLVQIIEPLPHRAETSSKIKITKEDPILALSGLGKEIWEGVDPDEYVRELREGWE